MSESSTPAGKTPPDPTPPNPVPSPARGVPQPIRLSLRFRPKPGATVTQVDVATLPSVFWPRAREWDSRMRNRNRWIGDEDLRTEVADIGRKHLEEWNVGESTVVALARAQVVEVLEDKPNPASHKPVARVNEAPGNKPKQTIHKPLWAWLTLGISKVLGSSRWISNAMQREMRRMPWESLLTMAARKYQNHEELLVYRRLGGLGDRKDTFATTQPLKALFIESA